MRVLGIDHGSVRIGLALSDELGMLASPFETVEAKNALARIFAIIQEKQVHRIVIGMPRNMDGSYGPKCDEVKSFILKLQAGTSVPIVSWDERLTTRAAERMLIEADLSRKKRKQVIDRIAAQHILQSYLDVQTEE